MTNPNHKENVNSQSWFVVRGLSRYKNIYTNIPLLEFQMFSITIDLFTASLQRFRGLTVFWRTRWSAYMNITPSKYKNATLNVPNPAQGSVLQGKSGLI